MKKRISFLAVFTLVFTMKAISSIKVTFSAVNPESQQIIAGGQFVELMDFRMYAQGSDSIVTSITFQRSGNSDDNVAVVSLYDNEGIVRGTGSFRNGEITFSGLHISLKIGNMILGLYADINSNTNSTTLGVNISKLSSLKTPNQAVNLIGNVDYISISPVVFSNNVYPQGWQFSAMNNYSQTIWATSFSVSTINVGLDTVKLNLSGTLPFSALSNLSIWINNNSYWSSFPGTLQGDKIVFVIQSGLDLSPGSYYINVMAQINPCSVGSLIVSVDDQKMIKYHDLAGYSYAPSGTYPLQSFMILTPCFYYFIGEDNTGTNAYNARFILQNVPFDPNDSTPLAQIYVWGTRANQYILDTVKLHWNGFAYEGAAHFTSLEAEQSYYWQVNTVIDGQYYYQNSTQQTNFQFNTKVCYEAYAGTTNVDTVGTNSAVISAKLQYPHPASGTEWYSNFHLLNEDKKDAYPSSDTSVVFGSMWQTPQSITDTASGSYVAKNLDSCTNYSYWFEFRQPCGGLIKSEVRHFRTKGNCHTDDSKLFIFPNPTRDYITVRFNYGRDSSQQIGIYDATGRLLKTEIVSNSQQKIDMSMLSPGMYIVNTLRKGVIYTNTVSGRFIKMK